MKDTEFLRNKIIAHRGVSCNQDQIPENSIIAFEKAMEKNYLIELDVHLLKDGKVVVFHDNNLKRMTGVDKPIKDYNYEELQQINLLGTTMKIPTLEEVLNLVRGRVAILIEIKQDNPVGELEKELVKLLDGYIGKFAVQSFHPLSINWFKKNRPFYVRGQLVTKSATGNKIIDWVLKKELLNVITKPDFISCNIEMLPDTALQQKRKIKPLLGWTVRTKKQYQYYRMYGDSLICETFI